VTNWAQLNAGAFKVLVLQWNGHSGVAIQSHYRLHEKALPDLTTNKTQYYRFTIHFPVYLKTPYQLHNSNRAERKDILMNGCEVRTGVLINP